MKKGKGRNSNLGKGSRSVAGQLPGAVCALIAAMLLGGGLVVADAKETRLSAATAEAEGILDGEALAYLPPPRKVMEQPETFFHRVPPPFAIKEGARTESATITVNFLAAGQQDPWGTTCLAFPSQAQAAFNHAAAIWSTLIVSSVPIVIEACWANLGTGGVLGYGGALGYYRDFPGAPIANTWYQVALANALSGVDRNGATPEIGTTYNAQYTDWYYGTDGNPAWNQIDLVSVVLHEICHGLGFSGSMTVSGGQGSWGSGTPYPDVYDRFAEDGAGTSLLNTAVYPNPSAALGNALRSNAVYFNGPHANAGNAGQRVRLYAPATWQPGSSYSHLDEIFNGTVNALMTYAINWGEALHHPGPVTMGLLQDLGWPVAGEEFPNIDVSPLSMSASQAPNTTSQQTLTVANTGDAELEWEIEQEPEAAGLQLPGAAVYSPESIIELILDDGTVDNNIGIGGNSELLWLNRFSPSPALFPFEIDEISVWFSGGTSNLAVGDDITLILFENTAGNTDPAVGASFLASFPETVQALDSWNVYTLPTPVSFNGPGDALIGVIAMETPGSAYFPAAIDTNASQGRSWAGWYTASPPPSPPTLPPDDGWTLIDAYYPGNWMVRASGQTFGVCTGLANVPWLGVNPDSGTTAAGGSTPVTVTFNSTGLAAGTYNANLCVFSNDPDPGPGNETELVIVPVSLEVTVTGLAILSASPLPSGYVGSSYNFTFTAEGGQPPYTWSVTSGALPAGLSLNGPTGVLSGTPTTAGVSTFTVRVTDSISGTADKPFELEILDEQPLEPVVVRLDPEAGATSNGNLILEPGETVIFHPAWHNSDSLGRPATGLLAPAAGPGGELIQVLDATADYGTIPGGETRDSREQTGNSYTLYLPIPAQRPSTHWHIEVTETLSTGEVHTWSIHVGDSFVDVGVDHWAYRFIETLLHSGITAGCSANEFCPATFVTRWQMGVFLAKAMIGDEALLPNSGTVPGLGSYTCGAGGTSVFGDIPPTDPACRHIHYIAAEEVTAGCGGGMYCPAHNLSRDQMAVFLVKAFHLSLY